MRHERLIIDWPINKLWGIMKNRNESGSKVKENQRKGMSSSYKTNKIGWDYLEKDILFKVLEQRQVEREVSEANQDVRQ